MILNKLKLKFCENFLEILISQSKSRDLFFCSATSLFYQFKYLCDKKVKHDFVVINHLTIISEWETNIFSKVFFCFHQSIIHQFVLDIGSRNSQNKNKTLNLRPSFPPRGRIFGFRIQFKRIFVFFFSQTASS